MIGRVLDTTALVAWARRASPFVDAVIFSRARHSEYIVPVVTTAPALAAALAQLPAKAAPVMDVLLGMDICIVDSLTPGSASELASTLKAAGQFAAGPFAAEHITAASIVHAAARRALPVVTGNPWPLQTLKPDLEIVTLP